MLDDRGYYWVSPSTSYYTYPAGQDEQQCFVFAGSASLFIFYKWPKGDYWELAVGSMTWRPCEIRAGLAPALRIVNIKFKK